jgi:hypothetical protein
MISGPIAPNSGGDSGGDNGGFGLRSRMTDRGSSTSAIEDGLGDLLDLAGDELGRLVFDVVLSGHIGDIPGVNSGDIGDGGRLSSPLVIVGLEGLPIIDEPLNLYTLHFLVCSKLDSLI